MNKVKVLFIGGYTRSGSTLLDLMLGQVDEFCSVGELKYIWNRGFEVNQLCGCRKKFKECEFWNNVVEEAFGGFQNVDGREIEKLRRSVERTWYIPQVLSPWKTSSFNNRFTTYSQILTNLYRAISKVSGSRFVVDSSKTPSHTFILNVLPDIELYVVHIIRDSRAVAYSWNRKKLKPEVYWKKDFMIVQGIAYTAIHWELDNILTYMLKYVNKQYTVLRYEDLARDPQGVLSRVFTCLGERIPSSLFTDRFTYNSRSNHSVSGNPIRFQQGIIEVSPEEEWQENMDSVQRTIVTTMTWPLLLKYGYLRRRSSKEHWI